MGDVRSVTEAEGVTVCLTRDGQRRVVAGSISQQSTGNRGQYRNGNVRSQTSGRHDHFQHHGSGRNQDEQGYHGRNRQLKTASDNGAMTRGGRGNCGRHHQAACGRGHVSSHPSVDGLKQAEQIKARLEECAYDDLLSKYFPENAEDSGSHAKHGEQVHSQVRRVDPGQSSSQRKANFPSSSHSTATSRHQGANSQHSSSNKGNSYDARQRAKAQGPRIVQHEHKKRSAMSADELLAEKERVEKALAEAERKLVLAEEEKRLTQLDCEQMRLEIVAVVGEKAEAVQRQAEAVQERDMLANQLDYLHMTADIVCSDTESIPDDEGSEGLDDDYDEQQNALVP